MLRNTFCIRRLDRVIPTLIFAILAVMSLPIVWAQSLNDSFGAAPLGEPIKIAKTEITKAGHPCPKIKTALRNSDGTISAICSNNEDYRIFSLNSTAIVMRCSAVREIGIDGC